jgi:tRNA modification GTPase
MDTIFALASAAGKAGVAVIRLSGPQSWQAVSQLAGTLPEPRRLSLRTLRDVSGTLDQALVVVFTEGASFTGEQAAELHLHGSRAVVSAVLRSLGSVAGLRAAAPGEFTRRALENGVLDLAQVEGLGDLIDAETEAQRRQAMRVLSGAIGVRVESWRGSLVRAAALIEATIDFADEDVRGRCCAADPGRVRGGDPWGPELGKIYTSQHVGWPRGRHHIRAGRHHARRDRSPDGGVGACRDAS